MLTHEDKELLAKKGISEEKIAEQLACFEKGFPFLKLSAAASVENGGIMRAEEKISNGILRHGMLTRMGRRKLSSLYRLPVRPAVCLRICLSS